MKSKIASLLTVLLAALIVLCSCEPGSLNFFSKEKDDLIIKISLEKPFSGMKISDADLKVTVNGKETAVSCKWSKKEAGSFSEISESDTFDSLSTYAADITYCVPENTASELLNISASGDFARCAENDYDKKTGEIKSRILVDVKRIVEINGTYPEEGKAVKDMTFTVSVDGTSVPCKTSWNEHSNTMRPMKDDEIFAKDILYSVDITYYTDPGTDYEYLEFSGDMGGGKYNGSGYIEETGELWSHIMFDPATKAGSHVIELNISSPEAGKTPTDMSCTVKYNGEEVPFTLFWKSLDLTGGGAGEIGSGGKFLPGSHISVTLKVSVENIKNADDVTLILSDNCKEISRELTEDGDGTSLSVTLSFEKTDGDAETTKVPAEDTTTSDDKTVNDPGDKTCRHTYKVTDSKKETCTEKGYDTYTCSKCGASYTETHEATGHDYKITSSTAPTCTAEGSETSVCTRCSDTVKKTLPLLKHDFEVKTTNVTCTENGITRYTCKICRYSYDETTAAKGHSYASSVTSEKTCTSDGVTSYTCSVCGDSYTETDAATGHSVTSWTPDMTSFIHSGTCTVCGEKVTEQHKPDSYTPVEDGKHEATCPICGFLWRESHKGDPCSLCGKIS